MNTRAFQLVVRSGPTPGKVYPIMKNEVIIGRDPNADILVNDDEVSRHHASIKLSPDGYVIEDLGSTNGTVINGDRLAGPHLLRAGEIISLGEHITLIFDAQPILDPDATMVAARITPPAQMPPQVAPLRQTAELVPPTPVPQVHPKTDPVMPGESFSYGEAEEEPGKKIPTWLIILLAVAVLISCICLISVLVYVDSNFLWCDLLPFLPGCQEIPALP